MPSPPDNDNDNDGSSLDLAAHGTQTFQYGSHSAIDMGADAHDHSSSSSAAQMDAWAAMGADASMSDSTVTTSPSLLGFDDTLVGDNTYQLGPAPFDLSGSVCGTQAEVIPSLAWSPGIDEDLLPWPYLSGAVMWDEHMAAPAPAPFLGHADPGAQLDLNVMGWMTAPSPLMSGIMPAFGGHVQHQQQQQQQEQQQPPQRLDQDVLLDHFRNSIILSQSVSTGDPVVQAILPLLYTSSAVRDAASALAGAHLARSETHGDIDHGLYHDRALGYVLAQGPPQDVQSLEQILAVLLLLLHYEVVSTSSTLGGQEVCSDTLFRRQSREATPTSSHNTSARAGSSCSCPLRATWPVFPR